MGSRSPLVSQEIYHVFNRGTEKRDIFLDLKDYERFLTLLYLSNGSTTVHISNHQGSTLMDFLAMDTGERLVDIAAYCLMPNHFHLLLVQREESGISKFMQKLVTGYTMYFNKKQERTGALFQGKFKSRHVVEDRYLKYLLSYIHLNPRNHATYRYSSYADFINIARPENKIITRECLPLYFDSPEEFQAELQDWISYRDESIKVEP
jgi:putative transposase